jgi:hypothetical protein
MEEIVKIWKKLKIESCTLEFDCGGDSMGSTSFVFFGKNGKEIESKELTDYFEDAVYDNVEFYVNSDGHYQGESGTVEITLNEDGDDFDYAKNAQSEYSESQESELEIELSPKTIAFIKENVLNINGGDGDIVVNFKRDFIMTDEQEQILEELKAKIETEAEEFVPELEDEDGEVEEGCTYTTNEDGEVLTIKGKSLKMLITNRYTEFRDSD